MLKSKWFAKNILIVLSTLIVLLLTIFIFKLNWGIQPNALQLPVTSISSPQDEFNLQIPQKALWRNYIHVSAEAAPGITCELLYIPPSGDTQDLSTVADIDGKCTWRWKIEETDGKGNGRLIITIDGRSETHFIEIRRNF